MWNNILLVLTTRESCFVRVYANFLLCPIDDDVNDDDDDEETAHFGFLSTRSRDKYRYRWLEHIRKINTFSAVGLNGVESTRMEIGNIQQQ